MKFTSLAEKAGSVAIGLAMVGGSFVPLVANATVTPSTITVDSVNGQPLPAHCVAGTVTVVVHGTTGNNGGPYSIDVGDGLSTTTAKDIVSGGTTPFSNVSITYTPLEASSNLYVFLYHGSASGADSHFTVINQCIAAPTQGVLTVSKHVDNTGGGTTLAPGFTLHVKQSGVDVSGSSFPGAEGGTEFKLLTGTYTVSEDANPSYTPAIVCSDLDLAVVIEGASVALLAGKNYACLITNTFIPVPPQNGILEIIKNVVGNALPSAFSFTINAVGSTAWNVNGINDVSEAPGSYSVVENPDITFTTTYSNSLNGNTDCSALTVSSSVTTICTVTNTFIVIPPTDADLSVTKSVDDATPDEGQSIVYTLTATNNGPAAATGIVVHDALPTGVTFVSSDGSYNSITGNWTVGSLLNGASATLHITVTVDSGTGDSTIANTASVSGSQTDLTPSNNTTDPVDVLVNCPQGTHDSQGTCVANSTTGTLHIVKDIVQPVSEHATADQFYFSVDGGDPVQFEADGTNDVTITAGPHSVVESAANDYTTTYDSCDGVNVPLDGGATCTITNTAKPATLVIVKDTVGGDGTFSFSITGLDNVNVETTDGSGTSGTISLDAGTYDVIENVPEGWDFAGVNCLYDEATTGDGITNGDRVILHPGHDVTCTFHDTIHHYNVAPVANDQSVETLENTALSITLTGSDADNGPVTPITFATVSNPSHGTLSGTAPDLTYTPDSGYFGPDSFTFTVNDGATDSNTGTISITVTAPITGGGGTTTTTTGGGGGSNFHPTTGTVAGASTEGKVLGESCGVYMDKHLRFGSKKNDPAQAKDLQNFLNKWMNAKLPVTGFYGPLTTAATKAFQAKYADDILKPWGITTPTGIVYFTTLHKINELECPSLTQAMDELVPWSANPHAQ